MHIKTIIKKVNAKFYHYYLYLKENLKYILFNDIVLIEGYPHSKNFGDALGTYILEKVTEKRVVYAKYIIFKNTDYNSYAVVGSIMHKCNLNSIIWGPGFIKPDNSCRGKYDQNKIYAIRGMKSKNILERNGYNVSDVKIGDPALLLPSLHSKSYPRSNKIGILPHYVDKKNKWIESIINENDNIILIDIECGLKFDKFLYNIHQCDVIISSTLHGLIIADAYQIKNVWVKFGNLIEGGNFKYKDYYSSIEVEDINPIIITEDTKLEDIIFHAKTNTIPIDLNDLLASFPHNKI